MNVCRWKRPLLSAVMTSLLIGFGQSAHAASEWKPGIPRSAYATLLEWNWDSVAKECTNFLGPKGYAAVQVSPPQEHTLGSEWWHRYQPVSYQLVSRGGNRTQFKNMVDTCKTAGVDVYVDTVINHMAGGVTGTGTAGTVYGNYVFPTIPYGAADFHIPRCVITSADYNTASLRANVTNCDMPGLPDLNTGSPSVQDKIAAYMNDLLSLGVAGFRIDAAKHISPVDLAAIKAKVPGNYFFTQEVIRDGSVGNNTTGDMALYQGLGTVNEFNFMYAMKNSFLNMYGFNLSRLPEEFSTWGFMDSSKATAFVHNHDTERKLCSLKGVAIDDNTGVIGEGAVCDSLNVWNHDKLFLADIFMLAYSYGYPSVASGYNFTSHNGGPTGQPYAGTEAVPANCSSNPADEGKWDCIHRDRRVANMVGFRNYTDGAAVGDWVVGDVNQIAFSRSATGFVAINNSTLPWQNTFVTSLADGKYCNVVASDNPETGVCPGTEVTVTGGSATLSIAPNTAVAIHVGAKVVAACIKNPTDFSFTTVDNVALNALVKSNTVTITGLTCDTPIVITANSVGVEGSYSIDGGPFVTTAGVIHSGQTLQLQIKTPASVPDVYPLPPFVTTVTVGTDVQTFSANLAPYNHQPTAPVLSWGTHSSPKSVGMNWTTAIDVDGTIANYVVARKVDSGAFADLATVAATTKSYADTVSCDKSYTYQVYAVDDLGLRSPASNSQNISYPSSSTPECQAGFVPTKTPVDYEASKLVATQTVTLYYKGTLASSSSLKLHWGINKWNGTATQTAMTKRSDGYWSVDVVLPATSNELDFVFTNGSAWDNNGGNDWKLPVLPIACGSCGGPVTMTFKINATTVFGESVYITGNQAALGNWSTAQDAARKCDPASYPVWTCTVTFPSGTAEIEYKYQKLGLGTKWESGANRTYTVPGFNSSKDDGAFRN